MKKRKREVHFGKKALANVRQKFPHVTNVVDATEPIEVELTPRDNELAKGNYKMHTSCPYAVCLTRTLRSDGALVALRVAYAIFGERAVRLRVPESITREIIAYDRESPGGAAPGPYKFLVPDKYSQLGQQFTASGRRGTHEGPRRPTKFHHITANTRTILGHSAAVGGVTAERPAPPPRKPATVPAVLVRQAPKEKRTKRK